MTAFEALIADFAQTTGLPLAPDESGACALEADGNFITLQYCEEADDVVLFAPVTEPDAAGQPSKAALVKALGLAYDGKGTAGAALGLFDGALILSLHLPMQGLDAETLGVRLTAFADAAVSVRAEIAAAAGAEGSDGGGDAFGGGSGDSQVDLSQLIRV